jgi:CubicO group peptidase (beta-lactamase class C family)
MSGVFGRWPHAGITLTRALLAAAVSLAAAFAAPARLAAADDALWPTPDWTRAEPADVGLDARLLQQARDYALTGGGSGYIVRHGRLVMSWGDPKKTYDLKSTTKSIGVTALGLALDDRRAALHDPAVKYHPSFGVPPESNRETGWIERITLFHLATQTAGFEKPGGYTRLVFEPGTRWAYSDGGPNWLAECLTLAYGRDMESLLFERVFTPLGITPRDLKWRDNAYRAKTIEGIRRCEFGSGVSANVDCMARIGYLYLREGRWNGKQLLSSEFVRLAATTPESVRGLPVEKPGEYGKASQHYGLLWWNNNDGTLSDVPRDAFWSWGLYDSLIVVIPSLDIVVARAGSSWKRTAGADHYEVLQPLLEPIVRSAARPEASARPGAARSAPGDGAFRNGAVRDGTATVPVALQGATAGNDAGDEHPPTAVPPYPPSPVIRGIHWAPADSIRRAARGSDNWPLTWADDDRQYTAYGDGRGFEPLIDTKLSLGLACVEGPPEAFRGVNLRAPSFEQRGDGARGKKASGMLMVDGVLYAWVRNAGNAQLAWSRDRGATWQWSDWRLTESFGYPTFLNFGRNYDGARDAYVYVYSHDHDSAYRAADRMVLARVPKSQIAHREAYEFFAGLDDAGQPRWSADVGQRRAVFEHPGKCYRSGITYNAPLRRYLWCQVLPGPDPRFAGGLGIYDAPEPWGPWTTVFFTTQWDVGPGETASIPTKWISDDGRTIHLVFSGNDCFSVRQGVLRLCEP